jgi:hypothetical protein
MAECIDSEARDRISKIWTELREHATDYWGPDKQNGKRSVVGELVKRVDAIEDKINHFEDTREASCLGLSAFRAYLKTREDEEAEMLIEKSKGKTLIQMQWIQVAGIVLVALIALLK